jgi:type IV pilus assembly protein PilX
MNTSIKVWMPKEKPMERVGPLFRQQLRRQSSAPAQRGAVMIVALIFLLLLTILAVSASGNSLLQERMSGGLRNAQQAQMSAETALRGAEWKLWSSSYIAGSHLQCGTTVPSECYAFDPANPIGAVVKFRTQAGWITEGATTYKGNGREVDYTSLANGKLAKNPLYIIEDMGAELPPGVSGGLHESGSTGRDSATSTAPHIYRITARASGGNANTVRVLETTFSAKIN